MQIQFVYMTAGSPDEARSIAGNLVESKLAACVNIIDRMQSVYVWKGKLQEDTECVLIAKTRADLLPKLIETVKRIHSYECPCIVCLPVTGGNPDFLEWIGASVDPHPGA